MISGPADPRITSDNLEIAQFLYLLLNNRKIRDVSDTITSKVVLILGRFSDERKAVLDAGQLICQVGIAIAAPMEFLVFEIRRTVAGSEVVEA